ncbi:MAG TPA: type II toxin-antitoxin system RelE/ParE family toxin [Myxococcota bacterium]|nr:type II toxin-antitoxin system RelE/ParE family toxin [Myxococcota bacterium]
MKLPLRISEDAEAEMADAARWYELHRRGLGEEFLAAVDAAIGRVEENPQIGSPTPGVRDASIRRVWVRRFPYHLIYVELPDRVQVVAVAHDRRRPGYWVGRLSS